MIEYVELGPVPCSEDCVQVGTDNYMEEAKRESRVFVRQLERTFPKALEVGCYFKTKIFPNDFGSYLEVVVCYDDSDGEQVLQAFEVENNTPDKWDAIAKDELNEGKL